MIICRIKCCGFVLMKCVAPTQCKGCTVKILINEMRLQDFSLQASKLFSPVPYPARSGSCLNSVLFQGHRENKKNMSLGRDCFLSPFSKVLSFLWQEQWQNWSLIKVHLTAPDQSRPQKCGNSETLQEERGNLCVSVCVWCAWLQIEWALKKLKLEKFHSLNKNLVLSIYKYSSLICLLWPYQGCNSSP